MQLPFTGYFETPFEVQVPGHPHGHQVRIWLPPSYHHSDDAYPVLWVTDNLLEHTVSAATASHFTEAPEVVVVAIGAPLGTSSAEYGARRVYDFMPTRELLTWDDALLESADVRVGGAQPLLDHLTGPLRERVAASYRTTDDHALAGHSGGAMFALYSAFAAYGAFSKYLIGSPAHGVDVERLERDHQARHGDYVGRLFVAAGGAELATIDGARARTLSTMASFCEQMVSRDYPGLDLRARVYPDCTHSSVLAPLFADGLRWLWRDAPKATLISGSG